MENSRCRCFKLILLVVFLFCIPKIAFAALIFDDEFTNTTKVDMQKTTAYIHTEDGGWVQLHNRALLDRYPNLVALREKEMEYAVVTIDGVKWFSYDESSGSIKENPMLSVIDERDAIGVSIRQDSYSTWVLTPTELKRYDFTGAGMTTNPYLCVSGLENAVSVTSLPYEDAVAVLEQTGDIKFFRSTEDGSIAEIPYLGFSIESPDDPIAVSAVPGTPDLAVATTNAVYYYAFDETQGSYTKNPLLSTIVGADTLSLSVQKNGVEYGVLTDEGTNYFTYDETSESIKQVNALSTILSDEFIPMSISIRPGTYEYAVAGNDENGKGCVLYYAYDAEQGKIVRNPAMEAYDIVLPGAGGLTESSEIYLSKYFEIPKTVPPIIAKEGFDWVRLTVEEDNDPDTSVVYKVITVDRNENTVETEIPLSEWVQVPKGVKFAVKAVLNTNNPDDWKLTPKILNVKLEATTVKLYDPIAVNITFKPTWQMVPTRLFPVYIYAGSEVKFTVKSWGYINLVNAVFDDGYKGILEPEKSTESENNIWTGIYRCSPDTEPGFVVATKINGVSETINDNDILEINPFAKIPKDGFVSRVKVRLIK